MVVLQTAQKRIAQDAICPITGCTMDYEIAGIFPVDRDVRLAALGDAHNRARWMEHVLQFRKSYLAGKDWLLLLGGNEGTMEEFQAAEALNSEESKGLRTCFIPCFGGTAMKLSRRRRSLRNPDLCHNGCTGWRLGSNLDSLADNVVKVLTET